MTTLRPRAAIFHLPVSPQPPDGQGWREGKARMSPAPDEPLIPSPPTPNSQSWAPAGWTDGQIDRWVDRRMDGWLDGWMNRQMDGWTMDGQIDGQTEEWRDGWMELGWQIT